jgi:hypothetical protein
LSQGKHKSPALAAAGTPTTACKSSDDIAIAAASAASIDTVSLATSAHHKASAALATLSGRTLSRYFARASTRRSHRPPGTSSYQATFLPGRSSCSAGQKLFFPVKPPFESPPSQTARRQIVTTRHPIHFPAIPSLTPCSRISLLHRRITAQIAHRVQPSRVRLAGRNPKNWVIHNFGACHGDPESHDAVVGPRQPRTGNRRRAAMRERIDATPITERTGA